MTARRGVTLVELLLSLPLIAVVGVLFSQLFPTLIHDVPRLQRLAEANTQVTDVLEQLRRDLQSAEALPDAAEGLTTGESLLLIRRPGSVVCYQVGDDGKISRRQLGADKSRKTGRSGTWPVAKARLTFRRWKRDGAAYAVEVSTAVRHKVHRDKEVDKLARTNVFYLSAWPGRRETP